MSKVILVAVLLAASAGNRPTAQECKDAYYSGNDDLVSACTAQVHETPRERFFDAVVPLSLWGLLVVGMFGGLERGKR